MSAQIIRGDCRTIMPTLGVKFDCCVTDPPYGDTSLDWDSECNGWLEPLCEILKPDASIWMFGSMRFIAAMFQPMGAAGFRYSQDIVWEKQNGTGFHNDRFRRVHEHAVMFYRGRWKDVYHCTQYTMDATKKTARRKKRPAHCGNINQGHYVSMDGGPRMMRSVIFSPNEHGRAIHPTQKPVEIIESLIRYSCPIGGSVIDPFAGSGSVSVAAINCGVDSIGIEVDDDYYKAAVGRILDGK